MLLARYGLKQTGRANTLHRRKIAHKIAHHFLAKRCAHTRAQKRHSVTSEMRIDCQLSLNVPCAAIRCIYITAQCRIESVQMRWAMAHSAPHPVSVPAQTAVLDLVAEIPWYVWCSAIAVTSTAVGLYWDISWHTSIGRDTFWTPAHLCIHFG